MEFPKDNPQLVSAAKLPMQLETSAGTVAIERWDALVCPVCGGNCLHQCGVAYFERTAEDGPTGTLLTTGMTQPLPDNPSQRRNGLAIEFSCESNCGRLRLAIVQHKGGTYFQWL